MSGTVLIPTKSYKRMKKKCLKKGYTTIYNKYNQGSIVRLINGKLIDSDGNREIISFEMNEKRLPPKSDSERLEEVVNPLMKKVIKSLMDSGLSYKKSLEMWSENMGYYTKMFEGKDLDGIEMISKEIDLDGNIFISEDELEVN